MPRTKKPPVKSKKAVAKKKPGRPIKTGILKDEYRWDPELEVEQGTPANGAIPGYVTVIDTEELQALREKIRNYEMPKEPAAVDPKLQGSTMIHTFINQLESQLEKLSVSINGLHKISERLVLTKQEEDKIKPGGSGSPDISTDLNNLLSWLNYENDRFESINKKLSELI